MAAAGPRGRDGPSPREFTAVRHFMMADLGLSGLPLLVYARIFGFCDAGCGYFESKGGLARFLNVQERSVHRAIRDLLDRGLIEECGVHAPARGHATKRYRIVRERLPPGALATPDDSSGFQTRKGDEMTGFAEAGYDVAFTTAKGMLERVKATFDEGGTEAAVARYAKCDVLVLDDLGKEDATEWSVGTVFSVLDARYEDMRPTIVTSNYAPGALADRLARRGERVTAEAIASRISQTCRTVYLGGRDRRRLG